MRANHGWLERWRRLFTFLKYDSDNVISNMSLPFYLEKKRKRKKEKKKTQKREATDSDLQDISKYLSNSVTE